MVILLVLIQAHVEGLLNKPLLFQITGTGYRSLNAKT